MTKKEIILLADTLKAHGVKPTGKTLDALLDFMQRTNPRFRSSLWVSYLRGECGPNGGPVKKEVVK